MTVITIEPGDDAGFAAAVDAAVDALRSGGTVVLPTDTVYGLAANPAVDGATDDLFRLKGRSADVPVAVLCADADAALALADLGDATPDSATGTLTSALAADGWPGPMTLVLPRRASLGWALGEPADTIGLRVPDHALVRAIAARVGPLATTSANRHGEPTPTVATDAANSLVAPVDLIIDAGELVGTPSTVLAVEAGTARILRAGSFRVDPALLTTGPA